MSYEGDGYVNSLLSFDKAMEDGNNTKDCEEVCLPNCDETTYEYTIDTTELNTEELCRNTDTKKVQSIVALACYTQYNTALCFKIALNLWRKTGNVLSWLYKESLSDAPFVISSEDVKDGLNIGTAEKICPTIFKNEIAHITLEIANPRVLEVVRDVKVTFPDMLGTVGKIMCNCDYRGGLCRIKHSIFLIIF
jgi:hypothetical protein